MPLLHPRFGRSDLPSHGGTESKDLDSIPEPLGWLCEALSLRLQRRQTLAFADLNSHLKPAPSAADVRSVSGVQPILAAIDVMTAHCNSYSLAASLTIRTARSMTSGEYFGCFFIAPSS